MCELRYINKYQNNKTNKLDKHNDLHNLILSAAVGLITVTIIMGIISLIMSFACTRWNIFISKQIWGGVNPQDGVDDKYTKKVIIKYYLISYAVGLILASTMCIIGLLMQ